MEARLRAEGWMQLCVSDTGCSIPSEDLPKVFDSFYQKPTGEGGVGLGLAIIEKLIELHGGRLWVDSAPGTGSRFYAALPLRPTSRAC